MSSSWLADLMGYGSLFEDQQPSNYYVNATKGLYELERAAKKQEIGGERNVAEGRAAQIAAQQGITGPAAAGLSHMATEGAQRTGDIATQNIDAESRKAQYAAMLKDREYAQQVAAAREKALYEMGQKGMALAGAGLTMGTNLGLINKDTPFFGGLSAALGNNVQEPGLDIPMTDEDKLLYASTPMKGEGPISFQKRIDAGAKEMLDEQNLELEDELGIKPF